MRFPFFTPIIAHRFAGRASAATRAPHADWSWKF